jgi:YbgC/YbaW family acyl-CoA thioester hydrolase
MSEDEDRCCFEFQRRVEFHETDLAGIVHFSNFYRYMETAEHAFLRSIGHSIHEQLGETEIGWPRVSATCEFRKPARYDDVLTIRVAIAEVRTRSVRYGFRFFLDPAEPPIAVGKVVVVCVKFEKGGIAAVPIPDQIRADLLAAQAAAC